MFLEHTTHKYQIGFTYTYKYEADLKTLLNATVDNFVGFSFNSTFNITSLSPCDLVLRVSYFIIINTRFLLLSFRLKMLILWIRNN